MILALDESYRKPVSGLFPDHELIFFDARSARRDDIIQQLRTANLIAMRWDFPFRVDRSFIESLPNLKFIHKSGSGVDGFDLNALNDNGILLANASGVNADAVAEHAILLILTCLRNAYWHMHNVRLGRWKQGFSDNDSELLSGKTVGILGMGRIGCELAKRLSGFGVNIAAYQRNPRPEPAILASVKWQSLDDILKQSDVVVLCLPLTHATERLIGRRELSLMKETSILINCARGRIVDEDALYDALSQRRLRAAGLDVFSIEPVPETHPLLHLDNVFATPHIAGRTRETTARQIEYLIENITAFLAGQRPVRLVNPEVYEGQAKVEGPLPISAGGEEVDDGCG